VAGGIERVHGGHKAKGGLGKNSGAKFDEREKKIERGSRLFENNKRLLHFKE
jgi:hypothetical protein